MIWDAYLTGDRGSEAVAAAATAIMTVQNANDGEPERFEAQLLARTALQAALPLLLKDLAAGYVVLGYDGDGAGPTLDSCGMWTGPDGEADARGEKHDLERDAYPGDRFTVGAVIELEERNEDA